MELVMIIGTLCALIAFIILGVEVLCIIFDDVDDMAMLYMIIAAALFFIVGIILIYV